MTEFSVATVNTLYCRVFDDLISLKPILNADIILFQEVINLQSGKLAYILESAGYEIAASNETCGLLIALKKDGPLKVKTDSSYSHVFERMTFFEKLLLRKLVPRPHIWRERGMLSVQFAITNENDLTVVDVHPGISFASRRIRHRQIRKLNKELQDTSYAGNLIVAGDMNYRPGPEAVDLQMQADNMLKQVDLAGQPTWIAKGWDMEWIVRIAMFFNRQTIESYDAQMDTILYRGNIKTVGTARTVSVNSDHRAVFAHFQV